MFKLQEEKRRAALVMRADSAQEDLPGWGDEEGIVPYDQIDQSKSRISCKEGSLIQNSESKVKVMQCLQK